MERTRLARTPFRRAGALFLAAAGASLFVAQQLAMAHLSGDGGQGLARRAIFFLSMIALVGVAWCFRRYAGAWLVAAGIALNFVPMALHGGLMPVEYSIARDSGVLHGVTEADIGKQISVSKGIILQRDAIRFYALTDRFVVTAPLYGTNVYSIGDFVLFTGVALAAAQIVSETFLPALRRGREQSVA